VQFPELLDPAPIAPPEPGTIVVQSDSAHGQVSLPVHAFGLAAHERCTPAQQPS
jgi:hypothetical protein